MHVFVVVAGGGLAAVLTFGFAQWCGDLVDAGRARSAADAAALAGVTGGESRIEHRHSPTRRRWSRSTSSVPVTGRR
ncbi:MAG: hypothetical protein WKF58_15565 [Ilumatobacteraceae bacterium]